MASGGGALSRMVVPGVLAGFDFSLFTEQPVKMKESSNLVSYVYICNIFCHTKLCMNDYFAHNLFSSKGDIFSLLFREDNRLGR